MKIACVCFNSNLIKSSVQESIVSMLKSRLYALGMNLSLVLFCNNSLETIKRILSENYDMIFCIGDMSTIFNHNIKENFATAFGDKMVTSDACAKSMKEYCASKNMAFENTEEMEILLPSKCIPLTDSSHYYSGFMYKHANTYVTFFPSDENFARVNFDSFVSPLILDITPKDNTEKLVLKCYGLVEKDLKAVLESYFSNSLLKISITTIRLDSKVTLSFEKKNEVQLQETIASICTTLKKYTYATSDISLFDTAVSYLSMQNKKVAVAETITMGRFASSIIKSSENALSVGYLLPNLKSENPMLPINQQVISEYGENSVNTVYELTSTLITTTKCDIGVSILGDDTSGDFFVAVGDSDGIHVYKNNISDSSEKVASICETTAFYLIKKLRENDLTFV